MLSRKDKQSRNRRLVNKWRPILSFWGVAGFALGASISIILGKTALGGVFLFLELSLVLYLIYREK